MIAAKVEPIEGVVDVALQAWLGPQARAGLLAEAARAIFAETDALNARAEGQPLPQQTFVDGTATESIERVHAEGVIQRRYDLMPLVLTAIGELLWQHSPVLSGRYQHSHRLLADDSELAAVTGAGWTVSNLTVGAKEFVFVASTVYAPLIEPHDGRPGESRQAPDGVYQVVAAMAQDMFGELARIGFAYRGTEPSIIVQAA